MNCQTERTQRAPNTVDKNRAPEHSSKRAGTKEILLASRGANRGRGIEVTHKDQDSDVLNRNTGLIKVMH